MLDSEVCTGLHIHLRSPCGKDTLGIIVVSSNGDESGVLDTLQELLEPERFRGEIQDPNHDGLHHDFVSHIVSHAQDGGCRVESGWGETPKDIAQGYLESVLSKINALSEPRSVTKRYYDTRTKTFKELDSTQAADSAAFKWIDLDIKLQGELRSIDNLRRAIRTSDAAKLQFLGEAAQHIEPHLVNAHVSRLRLFSANDEQAPNVSREKVYCIFAGDTLITLRDGESELLDEGLANGSVQKMIELDPTPAGMFFGLSEYCYERAEVAVDYIDDHFLKKIIDRPDAGGKLRSAELLTLQSAINSLSYIGRKFEEHEGALSALKRNVLSESANGQAAKREGVVSRELPNHAQDIANLIRRVDRCIAFMDRARETNDSIHKNRTDGDVVRLTLVAGASALFTGGAAAAIVEFISHTAQKGFFYGGITAAALLMGTAAVSWTRKHYFS